ncbi:MAG: hypothetical protein A2Y07_07465 [Planctomycetes bacterium GWF2_50_10]|nr:MAG: hypothetical protein A2Y07_07465 [Planctomycetes bacterium GWF2_50_10]
MKYYSNDADVLRYEPKLFMELFPASQVIARGSGAVLGGTSLTKTGEDFTASGVGAGNVVYINSAAAGIEGVFEVTGVEANDRIGVSVLRADESDAAVAVGNASDVQYRIATLGPQAREVYIALRQYFGLRDEQLGDSWELRQCSTYAVIASIYASAATELTSNDAYWRKSLYYQKLFARARERAAAVVDNNADGSADTHVPTAAKIRRD